MICRILGVSVLILASALAHSVQASKTTNPSEEQSAPAPIQPGFGTRDQLRNPKEESFENCQKNSPGGWTPIHTAASGDHVEAMEFLKEAGADINSLDSNGGTLMHTAAACDATNAMQWLKDNEFDIYARDNHGRTPMQYATKNNALNALTWLRANSGRE